MKGVTRKEIFFFFFNKRAYYSNINKKKNNDNNKKNKIIVKRVYKTRKTKNRKFILNKKYEIPVPKEHIYSRLQDH